MIPPELISILACPSCHSSLGLEELPDADAEIGCPDCGETYPYIGGVLGLFYVDSGWFWPVHELIALNEMARKARAGELEPDRVSRNTLEVHAVMTMATEMSDRAIGSLPAPRGETLLEVGSGSCTQAKELADRGFRVIAVDLNPMELLHPRPRYIDRLGEDFHADYFDTSDEFPREEIRFLRVAADIHNLPVCDAAVDWVHSRSMLHHLNPLAPALAEVGRVIRPGGGWNASAEPASSLLEWDPTSLIHGSIDYQEGVHESSPCFREYLRGFRGGNLDLERYEVWSAQYRINLGLPRRRRFRLVWSGREQASAGPIELSAWKASWMNTVGNFKLQKRRTARPRQRERPNRDRESFARPEWFFDPERHSSNLRTLLRRLTPAGALVEPAHLARLPEPEIQVRGFRLPEWVGDRPVCFASRRAWVMLPEPQGAGRLFLDLFNPLGEGDALRMKVSANDVALQEILCSQPGFFRVVLDLSAEISRSTGPLEIGLETDRLVLHSDGRHLGIAVERVGYVRGKGESG